MKIRGEVMKKIITLLMMFSLLFNGVSVNADEFVYGDADGDGVITITDAVQILSKVLSYDYVMPVENMTGNYMDVVDVDRDGLLTSADCAIVLQKILDSRYKMPCEPDSTTETTETTTAVSTETTTEATTVTTTETTTESLNIEISAGGRTFNATLYDNPSARAFMDQLPLTLNMSELNGNEKYYYMDSSYPVNEQEPGHINAGDLMLYGNSCIVLFYDSFSTSYDYTPLGHIDDPDGLADALGSGRVTVTFTK